MIQLVSNFLPTMRKLLMAFSGSIMVVLMAIGWTSCSESQKVAETSTCSSLPKVPLPFAGDYVGTGSEVESWNTRSSTPRSNSKTLTRNFKIHGSLEPFPASQVTVKATTPAPVGESSRQDLSRLAAKLVNSGFTLTLNPSAPRVYAAHETSEGGQPTTPFEQGAQKLMGQVPRNVTDDLEAEAMLTITGDNYNTATFSISNKWYKHGTRELVDDKSFSYSLKRSDSGSWGRHLAVSPEVQSGKLISKGKTDYTSRLASPQGDHVLVHVLISPAGKIEAAWPVSGSMLLPTLTLQNLSCWSYQPTVEAGQPVGIETDVDVKYVNR